MVYHGHPAFLWAITDFIQGLHTKSEKKLTLSFNVMLHNADDVLSLNNFKLGDFDDHIYLTELEIKNTKIKLVLLHTLTYA